jgi:uncharacterized protein
MMNERASQRIEALQRLLRELDRVKVAVSGGVDSMTLAILAGRALNSRASMYHALSSAVPPCATQRVKATASDEGWALHLVDAGEMRDEDYLRNPYRRCFHCKSHLYATLAQGNGGVVLSGANADDLDDFRPGLQAAKQYQVRHPFIECGVDKAMVRHICGILGFPHLASLPASPCLSSRIQTGIRIDAPMLGFVDRVETLLRAQIAPEIVRCRIRRDRIAVQLDTDSLDRLSPDAALQWTERIQEMASALGLPGVVQFEPYQMGSAFVEPT